VQYIGTTQDIYRWCALRSYPRTTVRVAFQF